MASLAPGLGVLIAGYSLAEGIGSALMIPPIYILVTVYSKDLTSRAKALGVISAAAGVGAAAGPLIGGLVTTAISWRASFLLQVLVVAGIVVLSRRITDQPVEGARPRFDFIGAVLTAAGLFFVVLGILQSASYGWFAAEKNFAIAGIVLIHQGGISPVWLFVGVGAVTLLAYFLYARRSERTGHPPLLPLELFRSRISNLGLVTQNIQWLVLQGSSFVISVFLQTVRHRTAIETGLILTPATIGLLVASALAGRMARNRTQRFLIRAGFVMTLAGIAVLIVFGGAASMAVLVLGLFVMGLGLGVMLTASANVVQSAFPEDKQGEISGLSRSVSNLGSSLGTAIVGSVLVAGATSGQSYGLALLVLEIFGLIGLGAAVLLPAAPAQPRPTAASQRAAA
jgi:MFS family permease